MPKKPFKPEKIAPLQRIVAEDITDPAERAALDKAHKEYKRLQRELEAAMNRARAKGAAKSKAKKKT